jgi:hypothetical protein
MGTLHEVPCTLMIISQSILKLQMFQTEFVDKIKTQILRSFPPPPRIEHLVEYLEKYGRVRQSTVGDTVQASWMLDVKSTNFSSRSLQY